MNGNQAEINSEMVNKVPEVGLVWDTLTLGGTEKSADACISANKPTASKLWTHLYSRISGKLTVLAKTVLH